MDKELAYKKLLEIGDPRWIYKAVKILGMDKELAYKKLLEIGDSEWIYYAARDLDLAKELAYKKLLEIGDPEWIKNLKELTGKIRGIKITEKE